MDGLILEPYAVKLVLKIMTDEAGFSLDRAVIFLTERLARRCQEEKGALIGHIKGFARGPEGSWLRVSVTDARRPAELEGFFGGRPEKIELTLNAHVLGLTAGRIEQLLLASMDDLASQGQSSASLIVSGEKHAH